jgi:hypothetical protein
MAIADSNRGRYAIVAETVPGTTPTTPAMQTLRVTGADFGATKETVVSNEVRSDRMTSALMEVGASASGGFDVELSLGGSFDMLIEAALAGTWSTPLNTTNVAVIAGNKFSATAGWANAVVGQFVYATGFTNAANNGWFRVIAATANDITVDGTLTVETASAGKTVKGRMLRNGTVARSFAVEEAFLDINQYFMYNGQRVGTWTMDAQAGQIVTGNFGFVGTKSAFQGTTFSGSILPATTTTPVNATANFGKIQEGATLADLATAVQSFNLSLDNALRPQTALGSKYPVGVGYGRQTISGSLNAYFENTTLYTKFLNHAATGLSFSFLDMSGNAMRITLPRVYFTSSNPSVAGVDQDVMEQIEWTAISDGSAAPYQIQIDMVG